MEIVVSYKEKTLQSNGKKKILYKSIKHERKI